MISTTPDPTKPLPTPIDTDLDENDADDLEEEPSAPELIRAFNLKLLQARTIALDTLAELSAPPPRRAPAPNPYAGLTPSEAHAAKLRAARATPQPRPDDPDQRRLANQERSIRLRAATAILRQKPIPDPTAPAASTSPGPYRERSSPPRATGEGSSPTRISRFAPQISQPSPLPQAGGMPTGLPNQKGEGVGRVFGSERARTPEAIQPAAVAAASPSPKTPTPAIASPSSPLAQTETKLLHTTPTAHHPDLQTFKCHTSHPTDQRTP